MNPVSGVFPRNRWWLARLAGCGLLVLCVSACGVSKVDEVSVAWPGFKDGQPVVLPSDPAQCPDLTGVYQATGVYRSGDKQAVTLKDLRFFLTHALALSGMGDTPLPEWQSTPQATVAFTPGDRAWDVLAQDGRGARSAGKFPLLNGSPDTAGLKAVADSRLLGGTHRFTGCAQGRLWISVRYDWRQYESMGVTRHVAMFRRDAGGLLVTMQRESDSIGLLPWYSNDSTVSQYWYAPAGH